MKLNKKIKKKWVKALRSGKYEQGHSVLIRNDIEGSKLSYCCLGVLCDVVGKKVKTNIDDYPITDSLGDPKPFLGLSPEYQDKLARFNDDGKSFNYIAYYIERYL